MKLLNMTIISLICCSVSCRPQSKESSLTDAFNQSFYSGSVATLAEARDLMSIATPDGIHDWYINAEAKTGSLSWNITGRKLKRNTDVSTLNYSAGALTTHGYRSHTWTPKSATSGSFEVTSKLDLFGDIVPPTKKLKFNVRLNYGVKPRYRPFGPQNMMGESPGASIHITCNYTTARGRLGVFIYATAQDTMYLTSDNIESGSVSIVTELLDLTDCKSRGTNGRLFLRLGINGHAVRFDSAEIQMLTEN
jgi:hypothetical protein